MKPDKIIMQTAEKIQNEFKLKNKLISPEESLMSSILIYLNSEAEKPKYACPNCHRIVDGLINIDKLGGNVSGCEYCCSN